jgi:oligopeptide transport system ATP-binding protein
MTHTLEHRTRTVPAVRLDSVHKSFRVGSGGRSAPRLTALNGVSLEVARGETVALVGESGCGKSTLARTVMMLEHPDSGVLEFDGVGVDQLDRKAMHTLHRRVQMVFQDPFSSLNARMTAGDLIAEPWRTHRDLIPSRHDRAARVRELLQLVGMRPTDAKRYPQEFSGGQRQRIGIARALALNPEVLVLDEPVSALDLSVQAQVINLLNDIQRELGVAYLFISHDLSVVRHVSDRVAVMYLGRIVEEGDTETVFTSPRHPYTKALLSAVPRLDAASEPPIVLKGEVPSPLAPPSGCGFRTRCWKAQDICAAEAPPATSSPGAPGHSSRCHFPLENVS